MHLLLKSSRRRDNERRSRSIYCVTHPLDEGSLILDLVQHVEIVETTLTREFLDDIFQQRVDADVEHSRGTLLIADVDEVTKQLFGDFGTGRRSGCDHGILVELVLLGQSDRLVPTSVFLLSVREQAAESGAMRAHFIEMRGQPSEL